MYVVKLISFITAGAMMQHLKPSGLLYKMEQPTNYVCYDTHSQNITISFNDHGIWYLSTQIILLIVLLLE